MDKGQMCDEVRVSKVSEVIEQLSWCKQALY
jgi:hypothetical protein